ncbi:hypothetical protein ACF8R6_16480, partial [Pseudomonas sp. CJQ_7]
MAISWIFTPSARSQFTPHISSQLLTINKHHLSLVNPWVSDSVFMGKLYTAMTLGLAAYIYPDIIDTDFRKSALADLHSLAQYIVAPLIFTPFIAYRIFFIKNLSNIYLNRATGKIIYQRNKKLISFDWTNIKGGVFKRTEFGGSSSSTSYALAFAPPRKDGSLHKKDCL